MNDEVKQGETIQSAEQQESERATVVQAAQQGSELPAAATRSAAGVWTQKYEQRAR